MKLKSLGVLFLAIAALSWGELSYGISDTPPQVQDNNNPSWNTPNRSGPLRPVQMPYGQIQDPRDHRTVYPDSGPGSAPRTGANPTSPPRNSIQDLRNRGIIHDGKWN